MTKKQGIRAFIFFVVLLSVIGTLNFVFRKRSLTADTRYNTFYKQKENTLDAVYIGTSGVDRYWAAPVAWHKYGIAVYPLSSNAQPFAAIRGVMRETLKTQTPKLMIVDIRGLRHDNSVVLSGQLRASNESFRSPLNRLKTVKELMDAQNVPKEERLSYYLPLIYYHDRWSKGLSQHDFKKEESDIQGMFYNKKLTYKRNPVEHLSEPTKEESAFYPGMEQQCRDLLQFCTEKNLNVLFIVSPYQISLEDRKMYNFAGKMIQEFGFSFFDMNNSYDEIGLDFNQDFYAPTHLNLYGAVKYTNFFAKYLVENYGLEDKRGDERYQIWEDSYSNLENRAMMDSGSPLPE